MFTLFGTLIFQFLFLSFLGTLALTVLIFFIGREGSGFFMASASVGISFTWFCGFILGTPDFPPEFNNTAILSATACLLLAGAILDFNLVQGRKFNQLILTLIILVSGITITIWMKGNVDIWSLPILLGWSIIALTIHRIGTAEISGTGDGALLLGIAAFGLGIIAWISNIAVDRDLAFGLCAILIGFFVCNLPRPRFYFGYSILLAGGGSLYMIAIRLVEQVPTLIPAFIILGFIFFTDNTSRYLQIRSRLISYVPSSIKLLILACFPLAVAALTTIVANKYSIS